MESAVKVNEKTCTKAALTGERRKFWEREDPVLGAGVGVGGGGGAALLGRCDSTARASNKPTIAFGHHSMEEAISTDSEHSASPEIP